MGDIKKLAHGNGIGRYHIILSPGIADSLSMVRRSGLLVKILKAM